MVDEFEKAFVFLFQADREDVRQQDLRRSELGYGQQKIANWFGVAASAGTPPQIIEALRDGFIKASQDEELQQKLSELATPVVTSTPERMRRLMVEERDTMEEFVRVFQLRN